MTAAVILNWNGAADTLACVESLLPEPDLQIVVVDNASDSADRQLLQNGLPSSISLIESSTNLGFAGGCNLGAKTARDGGAEFLLFVNNDAQLGPGCTARLIDALNAGWTAVNPIIWNGLPSDGRTTFWYEKGKISLGDFIVADHIESSPDDRTREVYESDLATGCVLAIRTEDFFGVGGFDEGLFAYFEDVDLALKLRKKGAKLGVVRGAEAWHRGSASSGGYASPLSLFYLFRNGPIVTERHATPEVFRAYRKKAPLQMLAAAANFAGREIASGAAAIHGAIAAVRGHRGVAPNSVAPAWLFPVAWGTRVAWKLLRPIFRKSAPKGSPDPTPREAGR